MDMPHFNMEGAPRAGRGGMPKPPKFEKPDIKVPAFEMPAYVGPSFAVYALLTFVPTIIIFMLSYNYFLRDQYFAGLGFFTVIVGALRGDLAERLGLALEAEHVPNSDKAKRRKVPVDAKGRPLTARGELDNAAMKAKFVSVALRARRHVLKGLSDEEYLRRCVAEAVDGATGAEIPKKRVKVASGLLTFLEAEENAVRRCTTVDEYNNVVKHENLAIIIGVSTDETPFAVEDAEKLTHHLFSTNHASAMGKYTTCLYTAESTGGSLTLLREKAASGRDGGLNSQHRTHMKPTSPNLMALIADIATCRSRRWGNVVVYVAAPMRTTPVMWLDEKLARDESTNFLIQESFVRKDMTCVIGDPNVVQGAATGTGGYYFTRCSPDDTANNAPPPLPRFTLEFLAETNDPDTELSWVDLNLFVSRLREAVAESNALIELTTQCLRAKAANTPLPKPSTTASSTVHKALRQTETSYTLLIDAAYEPEAARDSIRYLTSPDEFFCDPYVGISEEEIERHKKQQEQLQRAGAGVGAGEFRLVVPPNEKPLFMPPTELMDTLCKLTLHEAVAYSTVSQLLHQQNLSVMVTPRRNYFVEKSVRQSLMKQRMAVLNNALAGEGTAAKPTTVKTPASVLLGMLTESSSAAATSFGGGISTGGASHTNNPLVVGYSDFVRVLFEGFYHAVSATGTIPDLTARPSADGNSTTEAAAASAAMACPSIRGTPEDSSFYCGRMTPSSVYQYVARHPHMKCFAPLPALTNEDGTPIIPPSGDAAVTKSSASVTSTAAAGARVTTTAVPLVALFTRGRHLDSVLFSQVSLAPRGAHASVVPPLSLMPSTAMMHQCEECLMPYFLPVSEKSQKRTNAATFLHIYPSEDRPRYAATPIMQTLCWNAELLRMSTDGVHMFDLTSFIPSTPNEDSKSSKTTSAAVYSRDPKLMAEEVIMRLASSIIEHNSMAHFGTVPTYAEAVRVWSWLRECAVMTIMLLRADAVVGNPVYEEVTRRLRELLLKKTEEEEEEKDEKVPVSRLTLVFVYDTPANSVPAESAADHAPSIYHVSLPSASMLDVPTAFRSRYLTPALPSALCCTAQDLTLLSHTVAEVSDEVSSPTDKRAAVLTEQYQRRIQTVTLGGFGAASSSTPCVALEDACQSLFPTLGGSTTHPFLETYSGELTEYVAPLLRGFLLLRGAAADGNKVPVPSSARDMASEVLDAVLQIKSADVILRLVNIRPSVDQHSLQACLLAILQAARSSVAAAAGNTTHNGHAPRVPQCEVFAHFAHLLRPPSATMTAEKVTPITTPMFLRTVTLFSDCLTALQTLGLVDTGVFGNDCVVVNLLTPTSYSTSGYAASIAALALRSDNASVESAVGTTFAEDLIPVLLVNPLAIDALSMRYGDLLKVSRNATTASQESVSAAQDAVEALSYPVVIGRRNEETKALSYSLEKRTIYSTRFYQLAMPGSGQWVRTLSCVRAVIAYIRTALATENVASTSPQAALTLAHSIEMLVEEVCDSVFLITAVQSGPISGVIAMLMDAEAALRQVTAAAESKNQKTLSAVVGAKESKPAAGDIDGPKDRTKGSFSAVALNDIQAAIKRTEGYLSVLRYMQGASPSALPPPVAEFWTQLAHRTALIDGNVGRPPVFPEEPSTEKKIVLQEYKFDDDEENGDKNKGKDAKTSADADETNKAAAVKKDTNDELDDPRLFDGYCPIRLIRASKPPTSQPLTVAEQRQLLATEAPPKVQFMQLFEREDLGGDDDEPSTVEELGSDADEDDLAELQAKENTKRMKREAAREANAKGILLRTDKPVVMKARTYYRGSRDYLMLCNALPQQFTFPWADSATTPSTTSSPVLSAAVSCLAYVDDKLYAGHYNGDLTVLIPATGEIDHVLPDAHKGAPVVTIFPFGRKYEDMEDAMYYQSYQAKVGRGDDSPPDPALVYLREKKLRENGGKLNTSMVTASSLNRCIRVWPNNTLAKEDLEGGRAEPVMVLDREQSIKMKDPMARCFFTQLARRGVDERQFRQNVGNPEERNARSLAGYTSLTTGPHGKPFKADQDMGYKDTVLLCYGSTMEATQSTADAMYNEQSFVGVGGVTQCCASFTVPPGYAVTAAVAAPAGPNGEARVAVAVSEVEPAGNKLKNHRLMQFEVLRSA